MKQKGFAPILIILGVIVALGIFGGIYYLKFQKGSSQQNTVIQTTGTTTTSTTSPTSDQTANWQTYTSSIGAFSLKYPPTWVLESPTDSGGISITDKKPFGQGLQISTYPSTSNLSELDFLYTYSFYGQDLAEPSIKTLGDLLQGVISKQIKVDGAVAEEMSIGNRAGYQGSGVWLHNGSIGIYLLFRGSTDLNADANIQNQILSTFHFTKQLPADNSTEVKFDKGDVAIIQNGKTTKITSYGHNYSPILSPDKTKVAYLSVPAEIINSNSSNAATNVWVINIDGTNPIQVTGYLSGIERNNLYWIDNNRLLFSDGQNSVRMYTISTKSTQTIWGDENSSNCSSFSSFKQNDGSFMCNFNPRFYFSPDSKYFIVFKSESYHNLQSTIAIINLATLNVKTINISNPVFLNSFSSDSKSMNISVYDDKDQSSTQTISLDN